MIFAGLPGVDVSWIQGTIDWPKAARSGIAWAYCRAGESDWGEGDLAFRRNFVEAPAAGLVVGGYHVIHTDRPVRDQAVLFKRRLPDFTSGVHLPPAIDFEWIDKKPCTAADVSKCEDFAKAVADTFGCAPILYTNAGYLAGLVHEGSPLAGLDLWLAHYGVNSPTVPHPWTSWKLWQWGGNGSPHVPGIAVDVDRDVFNGDLVTFMTWVRSFGPSQVGPVEVPRADAVDPAPLQTAAMK